MLSHAQGERKARIHAPPSAVVACFRRAAVRCPMRMCARDRALGRRGRRCCYFRSGDSGGISRRCRITPSCVVLATRAPPSLYTSPRANPLPPEAEGAYMAWQSHSSARNGLPTIVSASGAVGRWEGGGEGLMKSRVSDNSGRCTRRACGAGVRGRWRQCSPVKMNRVAQAGHLHRSLPHASRVRHDARL